jgi:hypothetical protein
MKIGSINAKVSVLVIGVFVFFLILLVITCVITGSLQILAWGIPTLAFLLIFPLGLNYLSQSQYTSMIPQYEKEARPVRIRAIGLHMLSQPVRFEGVVERAYFQFLNRPQFLIADKSGEISVKMFTSTQEEIKKGDVVEVLGMVMKRYIVSGDAVINCVSIRKIKKSGSSGQQ